ncbi:hypothetical protein VHUM_01907 [Vanrija humicola]|uniref:DH domain-containing protein n=1 Tax=Vanrija humicola TaxID=5417 RepID=A0A7D8Z1C5_VANHU|nr:hypothetical protein VHUM_01907 [Vanrija humicola]
MSPQSSSQGANGVRRGPSVDESQAKRNPLDDLVETEKVYVEQLTLVIRRVAAAWSRRNLPPPKLDAMFRCIEAVYRANRAFAVRLKDIAANPANAKALGDLLMRWIDDLEPSYGRYGTIYLSGFDSYQPVSGNPGLAPILDEVTVSCPPSPPVERWTLDALFILPYTRLRYYRKLYTRLLRNTQEGRSDHRLLANANERLETLIADVERRLELDVSEEDSATTNPNGRSAPPALEQAWPNEKQQLESRNSGGNGSSADTHSHSSSFTSRKESSRTSATSAPPSAAASPGRGPPLTVTTADSPITDLELRIDTERTIDLFSMQPRKCKLQMNAPGLTYSRLIRSSHDATVFFTPSSTGQQVVHRRAHIFILTDLFLITDRMEASEKAAKAQQVAREQPERVGERGPMPEMWLAYPPLAGKHLVVVEGQQSNVLAVTVMRKETFVIHANSEIERDQMVKSIQECIDFASGMSHTPPTVNTPPVPSMDGPRSVPRIDTNPPARYPSPMSPVSNSSHGHYPDASLTGHMQNMSINQGDWTNPNSSGPPPRGASLRGRNDNTLSPGQMMSPGAGPGQHPASPMIPENPRAISTRSAQSTLSAVSALSTQSMPPNMNRPPPQPMYNGQQGPYSAQGQYGNMAPPPVPKGPAQGGPSYNDYAVPTPLSPPGPRQGQGLRLRDDLPPIPQIRANGSHLSDVGAPSGYPEHFQHAPPMRSRSAEPFRAPDAVLPPSARMGTFHEVTVPQHQQQQQYPEVEDDSPPASPTEEVITALSGPTTITAQMKCKLFLNNGHQQWKSLGSAKLKLFVEQARNVKQLVVEDSKKVLISTIVLTDGVERVGRTGVAIELSTNGQRSGHVYMIQLRNEASADGLHESLLAGSDRARNH